MNTRELPKKIYTREFEKKYLLGSTTFYETWNFLGEYLGYEMSNPGTSTDYYWEVPGKYEFVRLRSDSAGSLKITTKYRDRGNQEDRSELEDEFKSGDLKHGIRLLNAILGTKPVGSVEKDYVLFHPKPGSRDCISVELVKHTGDVLVEVEGVDFRSLEKYVRITEVALTKLGCQAKLVEWSIYEHYVAPSRAVNHRSPHV